MEETNNKEFNCKDENGNLWRLTLKAQEKYPTRFDLCFHFNEKVFNLQHFGSTKNADNMWELIEMLNRGKKEKVNAENID